MRTLTVALLTALALAMALVPQAAHAETLTQRTPWVSLDQHRSFSFGNGCADGCVLQGSWVASCPTGYTFDLARGARTAPQRIVLDVQGRQYVVDYGTWWTGQTLHLTQIYKGALPDTPPPPPASPDFNEQAGFWDAPQSFLCEKDADPVVPAASAAQVRDGQEQVHQVRHVTRTFALGEGTKTARVRCAPGETRVDSGASVGVFSPRRPSRRHGQLISMRHLPFARHAFAQVKVHPRLDSPHQLKLQLRVACQAAA